MTDKVRKPYLYQQQEAHYLQTIVEQENEKAAKALEDRKRSLQSQIMSIDDLKHHWREYKRQQKLKEEENEERRKETRRKQREAADWIHSKI